MSKGNKIKLKNDKDTNLCDKILKLIKSNFKMVHTHKPTPNMPPDESHYIQDKFNNFINLSKILSTSKMPMGKEIISTNKRTTGIDLVFYK